MSDKRMYIVTYVLNSDNESINIITLIAMKEFGETGVYTELEAQKVVDLLSKQKVPQFIKTAKIGEVYEYKTFEEWHEFVEENKIKIKNMLDNEQKCINMCN